MKHRVKFSAYSLIMSIVGIAIIVGVMVLRLHGDDKFFGYVIACALVYMCVMALFYAPMSISVDDRSLNVNRPLRVKSIPLADIKSVELCSPTMSERRICGSGGWLGYWGWFREPSIGKYFAYYGKASDCFLVRLKDGRQYLLGCANPAPMVEFIKSKI